MVVFCPQVSVVTGQQLWHRLVQHGYTVVAASGSYHLSALLGKFNLVWSPQLSMQRPTSVTIVSTVVDSECQNYP